MERLLPAAKKKNSKQEFEKLVDTLYKTWSGKKKKSLHAKEKPTLNILF